MKRKDIKNICVSTCDAKIATSHLSTIKFGVYWDITRRLAMLLDVAIFESNKFMGPFFSKEK